VVDGQAFVVLNRRGGGRTALGSYPEIAIFDIDTGQRRTLRLSTAWQEISFQDTASYTLIGVANGKVWLNSTDLGVHARDPHTGAVLQREEQLIAGSPLLTMGTARHSKPYDYYQLDHDSGDLCLERSDHFIVRLNPETLAGRVLAPNERGCIASHEPAPGLDAKILAARVHFAGSPRARLVVGNRAMGLQSYFKPTILEASHDRPIAIDDPLSVVVAHLVGEKSVALSRVSLANGDSLWSTTLSREEAAELSHLKLASLYRSGLLVLTDGGARTMDAATGRLRWSALY
jgi:outer membrane protein assembly factor BamB